MQSKLCVIILKGFHGFSAMDLYKFVSVINIIICTNSRKREKNLPFLHNSMEYVQISILVFLLVNSSHYGDAKFKFMQEGNTKGYTHKQSFETTSVNFRAFCTYPEFHRFLRNYCNVLDKVMTILSCYDLRSLTSQTFYKLLVLNTK